jgi:hypothetical protein
MTDSDQTTLARAAEAADQWMSKRRRVATVLPERAAIALAELIRTDLESPGKLQNPTGAGSRDRHP